MGETMRPREHLPEKEASPRSTRSTPLFVNKATTIQGLLICILGMFAFKIFLLLPTEDEVSRSEDLIGAMGIVMGGVILIMLSIGLPIAGGNLIYDYGMSESRRDSAACYVLASSCISGLFKLLWGSKSPSGYFWAMGVAPFLVVTGLLGLQLFVEAGYSRTIRVRFAESLESLEASLDRRLHEDREGEGLRLMQDSMA